MLLKNIYNSIKKVEGLSVSEERKKDLQPLINFIQSKTDYNEEVLLNFICTHNSRRSHLAQVWAQTMAYYFEVSKVKCYSGGTAETALYHLVKETLEEEGFKIIKTSKEENPKYQIIFSDDESPIIGFSKKYDNKFNPQENFAAILTCSHADKNCPIILGAEKRITIAYQDPKLFDNSPLKKEKYKERSLQIASEMFYVFSKIN